VFEEDIRERSVPLRGGSFDLYYPSRLLRDDRSFVTVYRYSPHNIAAVHYGLLNYKLVEAS